MKISCFEGITRPLSWKHDGHTSRDLRFEREAKQELESRSIFKNWSNSLVHNSAALLSVLRVYSVKLYLLVFLLIKCVYALTCVLLV